jgi:enamine deaminase RidA (YjgF/YER057c/UK114 family)
VYAATTAIQLRQTMRNLLDNLEEAGMDLDEIVSTNIYLDNSDDLQAFDEVYGQYIGPVPPARSVVQQVAPADRKPDKDGHYPDLEQVSLIALRKPHGQ